MSAGGARAWAGAALGAVALAAAQAPLALTGRYVFWAHDLRHHHTPWRAWVAGSWAAGEVPLWAPTLGLGFPIAADGQVGAWYPPNLALGAALDPWRALTAALLLHSAWAGLGAWALARAVGLRGAPAALLGVAWPLGGFLVSHLSYGGMQAVAAWMPWLFAALLAPGGSAWAVGLCVAALLTAGHVQLGVFALLGGAGLVLGGLAPARRALAGLLLGVVPAGAQLAAAWELGGQSERAGGVDAGFGSQGSLPPPELLNALLPRLWGWEPPAAIPRSYLHKAGGYFGLGESHWEGCFYLGVPVIALALFARGQRVWKALALLSALLMLGGFTPAWPLLRRLPGLDHFRFPVRFSAVFTLAVGVLAAWGLQRLVEEPALRARLARGAAWAAGALALAGGLGGLGLRLTRELALAVIPARVERLAQDPARLEGLWDGLSAGLWPGVLPTVGLLLALAALAGAWTRPGWRAGAWALVGLLALDLGLALRGYNPLTPLEQAQAQSPALPTLRARGARRLAIVDRVQPVALDSALMSASASSLWGLADVLVPSPLHLAGQEALLAEGGLDLGPQPGPAQARRAEQRPDIAALLSVDHLLTVHTLEHPALERVEEHPAPEGLTLRLYAHRGVLPRARVHPCAPGQAPPDCPGEPAPATWIAEAAQRVVLQAPGPGLLVLADAYYPGWGATVDGVEVPIEPVHGALRGVRLGAGVHEVVFRYRPRWAPLLLLVWPGWVALGLGLAWTTRRARPTLT